MRKTRTSDLTLPGWLLTIGALVLWPLLGFSDELAGKRGLYPVSSRYFDEAKKMPISIRGTGTAIGDGDRLYILTASHVSGGKDRKVEIEGASVEVLGSLANPEIDLELFEIGDLNQARAAIYDPGCDCFMMTRGAYHSSIGKASQANPDLDTGLFGKHGSGFMNSGSVDDQMVLLLPPWMEGGSAKNEFVVGDTARSVLAPERDYRKSAYLTRDHFEYYFPIKILNGMSGAPFFHRVEEPTRSGLRMVGLAKRFLNQYKGTFAVAEEPLLQLVNEYRAGKRGTLGKLRWSLKNCLLYRQSVDQSVVEILTATRNAGGGASSDGGGGASSDGGGGACQREMKEGAAQFWSNIGVLPGIIYGGKPVIAFHVEDPKSPGNPPLTLQADLRSYAWVENLIRQGGRTRVIPISPPGTTRSLLPFFQERAGSMEPDARFFSSYAGAFPFFDYSIPTAEVRLREGRIQLSIPVYQGSLGSEKFEEALTLEIDENGMPHGRGVRGAGEGYQPLIQVSGPKSGKIYFLDVSRLFFEDLSAVLKSEPSSFPEITAVIPRTSRLAVRLKREDQPFEYELFFNFKAKAKDQGSVFKVEEMWKGMTPEQRAYFEAIQGLWLKMRGP